MVLIRNDLLDRLPTPFSRKSSCEIPLAIMFVFQKIYVMHSHLISRLPSAYEMHYAISIIFIPIYIKYAYILKFTFTPHVIQSGSNNTQISSLEQITISSPMAYTHNYIPYNLANHNFISDSCHSRGAGINNIYKLKFLLLP